MINKIVGIVFVLVSLWYCKQQPVDIEVEKDAFVIELKPKSDTLKLSSLFQLDKIITFDSLFLSDIIDVQTIDSNILVRSKSGNKDLHLFDHEGRYLKSFVQYGRAKNEILNLQNICFNKYKNTIDILCNYGMKINQYSYPSGKLHNQIIIPTSKIASITDFEVLDSVSYMFYKNLGCTDEEEYKLYKYNYVTSEIENEFLKLDKQLAEKISIGQHNNLYTKKSDLYFYEAFQDGIYKYDRDSSKMRKRILFQQNEFSMPDKILRKRVNNELEFIRMCRESQYIWAHINCIEFKDKIFSYFTYKKNVYGNIIDLHDKTAFSYMYVFDDLVSDQCYPAGRFNIINADDRNLICTLELYSNQFDKSYILLLNYK